MSPPTAKNPGYAYYGNIFVVLWLIIICDSSVHTTSVRPLLFSCDCLDTGICFFAINRVSELNVYCGVSIGIIGTSSAWSVIIQRTAAIIVTIIITTSSSSCDVTVHVIYLVIVLSLSDLSRGGSKNDGSLGRYPSVAGYRSRTSSGASVHPP